MNETRNAWLTPGHLSTSMAIMTCGVPLLVIGGGAAVVGW